MCIFAFPNFAAVVELVDTLDLGSSAARRGGSTPFSRTKLFQLILKEFFINKAEKLNPITLKYKNFDYGGLRKSKNSIFDVEANVNIQ